MFAIDDAIVVVIVVVVVVDIAAVVIPTIADPFLIIMNGAMVGRHTILWSHRPLINFNKMTCLLLQHKNLISDTSRLFLLISFFYLNTCNALLGSSSLSH